MDSKWIKDLNIRAEAIKFLVENAGSTLFDIILQQYFFKFIS